MLRGHARIRAPRCLVAQPFGIEVKPIEIRRGRAVFQRVMKLPEAAAGMIEHTIGQDADAARVRPIDQFAQRRVAAQNRIDVEIVVGVIAVIGR